jgi:hypothetical protein
MPIIDKLSLKKTIFWMSGDIGVAPSLPLFYDRLNRINIIATGLGDNPCDLILKINVSGQNIKISGINLLTHQNVNLKDYNMAHWENYFQKSGVIKRKLRRLLDRNFLIGVILGIFTTLILWFISRKLYRLFYN